MPFFYDTDFQVLTGQPKETTGKVYSEDTPSAEYVENIPAAALLDAVQDGGHEYQAGVQVVADAPGPDQDHAHYTHVADIPDGQVCSPSCSAFI